ncbi:hypothetical protein OROMI_006646 [Orobanche minor]
MEQPLSSIAFRGSVIEAIAEAKIQKKLFVVYTAGVWGTRRDYIKLESLREHLRTEVSKLVGDNNKLMCRINECRSTWAKLVEI